MLRLLRIALALGVLAGCVAEASPESEHAETVGEQESSVSTATWSAGSFGFTSLDVGQGDAAVVLSPHGCAALLDAGPTGSGKKIKPYLRELGVEKLDFAVVSHYHEDHFGGIDEVEQGSDAIHIDAVYDHGGTYSSGAYRQYDARYGDRRVTVRAGESFSLCGEVDFTVVASDANGNGTSDENARSVTVKVSYGALDILVGGDLTDNLETPITANVGPVEVYKVHHHGSAGSSSARFLDAIKPTVSFISVAANNSYGHPAPSTLLRLQDVGSTIWETKGTNGEKRGNLSLVSRSGDSYTVTQNAQSASYTSKP